MQNDSECYSVSVTVLVFVFLFQSALIILSQSND